jgi:hypothetical protein
MGDDDDLDLPELHDLDASDDLGDQPDDQLDLDSLEDTDGSDSLAVMADTGQNKRKGKTNNKKQPKNVPYLDSLGLW